MSKAGVGGLLRKARLTLEMPLREVAAGLGVSTAYVSDVELGRRKATAKRIPQFITVLKFSPEEREAVYKAAGLLPEGLANRLVAVPEMWNSDFRALVAVLPEVIGELERNGTGRLAKRLRTAFQGRLSRRKK